MMLSMFADHSRPFYNSSEFIELNPIDKDKYSEFIRIKMADNKIKINDEAINKIFDISRVVTYYIQLVCDDNYNLGYQLINIGLVDEVINNLVREKRTILLIIPTC